MTELKHTVLFDGLTREAKAATVQPALEAALSHAQEGIYRVFDKYDAETCGIVEVSNVQNADVEILQNGAMVNAKDLPNGQKAGEAYYLGTIRKD